MFASGTRRGADGPAAAPGTARPVRPLSAEDLSILALENQTVAGHTCKVIVLRNGISTRELRSSIAGRLDRQVPDARGRTHRTALGKPGSTLELSDPHRIG